MYQWRNPRSDVPVDDRTAWPELCSNNQARSTKPGHCQINRNSGGDSKVELKESEYPCLAAQTKRSRQTGNANKSVDSNVHEHALRSVSKPQKFCIMRRRFKRTEKICIDLREIVESAYNAKKVSETESSCPKRQAKSKNDSQISDTRKIVVSRIRRQSKLKRIILLERKCKHIDLTNRQRSNKCEDTGNNLDVDLLDLKRLKIVADPKIDVNYVRQMSALSFYGKDYRHTATVEDNFADPRFDLTDEFQNLSVTNKPEISNASYRRREDLDPGILQKTLSLDISDVNETIANDSESREKQQTLKFTKNFREYCTNVLSPSLNSSLEKMLAELSRLQRRLYERDCTKGKYKRRYYSGLKETLKYVELKKVKLVLIAPDLEKGELPGGLNERVCKLLDASRKCGAAVCFGLRRRKLGYFVHGKGIVACIGIANYGGLEEIFKDVLVELLRARNHFRQLNGQPEKVVDFTTLITDESLLLSEKIGILLRSFNSVS